MAWAQTELFSIDIKEVIPTPIGAASVGACAVHARESRAANQQRGAMHVTGLR